MGMEDIRKRITKIKIDMKNLQMDIRERVEDRDKKQTSFGGNIKRWFPDYRERPIQAWMVTDHESYRDKFKAAIEKVPNIKKHLDEYRGITYDLKSMREEHSKLTSKVKKLEERFKPVFPDKDRLTTLLVTLDDTSRELLPILRQIIDYMKYTKGLQSYSRRISSTKQLKHSLAKCTFGDDITHSIVMNMIQAIDCEKV